MKLLTLRWLYFTIGALCTALGVIGAFLPVMPTTVFLIIAVWAFGKSCPRLERWLLDHPRFGPTLRAFAEYQAIPFRVKCIAVTAMLASVFVVYGVATQPLWVILHAALVLATAVYIVTRPGLPVTASH